MANAVQQRKGKGQKAAKKSQPMQDVIPSSFTPEEKDPELGTVLMIVVPFLLLLFSAFLHKLEVIDVPLYSTSFVQQGRRRGLYEQSHLTPCGLRCEQGYLCSKVEQQAFALELSGLPKLLFTLPLYKLLRKNHRATTLQ
ncbi:hypothetical protein K431DRAFT_301239 [Polychaeton citri CBS 116435]|uniref:Uncharacterized protein n=1 Tax=Polychaeton citri CBS 116435 TaxID=1314669 RepID=A0A9P4UTI2_9PEZI|nr:hypothetical protein K431DRAFT_301239 [Polychaeton citri CBS 116435]